MKKLFLDMDGVVFDTISAIVKLYNTDFNDNVDPQSVNTWHFEECTKALWSEIDCYFSDKRFFNIVTPIDADTFDYIERLSYIYDITFVTIGATANLDNKKKWLRKHLNCKYEFIGLDAEDKSSVDMSGGIFVDDVDANLVTSNAEFKICFGNVYCWNSETQAYRCNNWAELYRSLVVRSIYMDDKLEIHVTLNTISNLKDFCTQMAKSECGAIARQGKYVVDACSLLGILSLDILKPFVLELEDDSDSSKHKLEKALFDFKNAWD